MAQILAIVRVRVGRLLARCQLESPSAPAPAAVSAASATSRTSVTSPLATPARPSSTASISTPTSGCRPTDRARLEHLCRYLLRPPLAQHRVHLRADGRVLVELKTVWRDGTSHLLFEPIELLEKNGGGLSYTHSECGPRQVPKVRLSLVNGMGGMLSAAGTLVLSRER